MTVPAVSHAELDGERRLALITVVRSDCVRLRLESFAHRARRWRHGGALSLFGLVLERSGGMACAGCEEPLVWCRSALQCVGPGQAPADVHTNTRLYDYKTNTNSNTSNGLGVTIVT